MPEASSAVSNRSASPSVDLAARTRTAGGRQATLDLAEAAKAHELLESGSVTGKIALTV